MNEFPSDRYLYVRLHLDANRINARQGLPAINQLEEWHEKELLELFMSEVAHNEARRGRNPTRSHKTLGYIYSMTMATTPGERAELRQIETLLGGGAELDNNTRNDAEIVFNAKKYSAILVTADGGILDHRTELKAIGVRVMTDDEAVQHVRQKIVERDRVTRQLAEYHGRPVPEWVGQD